MNVVVLDSIDREILAGRYGYVDRLLVLHDPTGSYNYFDAWWHPF